MALEFDQDVIAAPTYQYWKSSGLLFHKIRPFVVSEDLDLISKERTQGRGGLIRAFEQIPAEVLDPHSAHLMSFANSIDAIPLRSGRNGAQSEHSRLVLFSRAGSIAEGKVGDRRHTGVMPLCILIYRNLSIPIDACLTWEQVIEFRRDIWSVHQYRLFRTWIQELLPGYASSKDILCGRISQYEQSLKKHGIATARGTIEVVFERAQLVALALAAGITGEGARSSIAALADGTRVGESWIRLDDFPAELAHDRETEIIREISISYRTGHDIEQERRLCH